MATGPTSAGLSRRDSYPKKNIKTVSLYIRKFHFISHDRIP